MAIKRIVPNLACKDPQTMASFFTELFGMDRVMDMDWITTVSADGQAAMQISAATEGGSGTAVPNLSIEVDDIEEVLARARSMNAPIPYGPVDEPWGVRRFYVEAPEGVLLNILCHA